MATGASWTCHVDSPGMLDVSDANAEVPDSRAPVIIGELAGEKSELSAEMVMPDPEAGVASPPIKVVVLPPSTKTAVDGVALTSDSGA